MIPMTAAGQDEERTCDMSVFLVYNFSGEVDEISHLFPSERLARIAGVIAAAGQDVAVVDRANFRDILDAGANFMETLASLSFDDTAPLYEKQVRQEAETLLARRPDGLFLNLWRGTGFKFSMDLLARLKKRAPALRVYGIGQKVDEFKERIFEFAEGRFDGLICGLGYDAVAQIVRNTPREQVHNLLYEQDGRVVATERHAIQIDDFPDPLYRGDVYGAIDQKAPVYSIALSNQACPNQCAFCIRPQVYGRRVRKRDVARVVDEIGRLHAECGATHFRIEDSTPARHALTELAAALTDSELMGRIRLSAFARVDSNGEEDFSLLRKAGLLSLFFGIESLDEPTLRMLNKRTTCAAVARTLRLAHDAGIWTVGSFIFPTPGATRVAMENTLRRMAELKPWLDSVLVLPAGIQPGTDWARNTKKYGIRLAENYVRDGVIYPVKYLVPMRHWKPFPFSYRLMGREAEDTTFEDIVKAHEEFTGRIRHEIGIPGIPDYYYLVADMLGQPAEPTARTIVEAMMRRDYKQMQALFTRSR